MKYTMGIPATEQHVYGELSRLDDSQLQQMVDLWEGKSRIYKFLRWAILYDADIKRFEYESAKEILTNRANKRLVANS